VNAGNCPRQAQRERQTEETLPIRSEGITLIQPTHLCLAINNQTIIWGNQSGHSANLNVYLEKKYQKTSHQVTVEHKEIILSNPPLFLQSTLAQCLISNLGVERG